MPAYEGSEPFDEQEALNDEQEALNELNHGRPGIVLIHIENVQRFRLRKMSDSDPSFPIGRINH